ncbi:MAG: cysteine synthase A [Bacteroidales bacterium]|jgi:cysteine synthase A|nr:cysteine synthase A [Bacteroidales bacterium]
MKYLSIDKSIGATPHIRLSRIFPNAEVWLKDERRNPSGSIKDRAALAMVEDAEREGLLKPGSVIVEPTSGNTGIGLAMVAAVKGYRLILTMPESMSVERRVILKAYGAEIILTPAAQGMQGAIDRAKELMAQLPSAWMPMQFANPANPNTHSLTTAKEILADFPEGLDMVVAGVGTAGHITGVGRGLKTAFPNIQVIAVEPFDSPVLSGGQRAPHPIQGIGAGFVPQNLDRGVIDEIITIKADEAFECMRLLARTEGILAGISSGANIAAVKKLLSVKQTNPRILTFAYDTGERYLSVKGIWD